jgi:hypothetical protein
MSKNSENGENGEMEKNYEFDELNEPREIDIFRFKFTQDFMDLLFEFSKVHQYDNRKDFKEAWKTWTDENKEVIAEETDRLNTMGYRGDAIDKMFKSARYYFRNKTTDKKKPKERRDYICVGKDLLESMDAHIQRCIENADYKPSIAFLNFCNDPENKLVLQREILHFHEMNIHNVDFIQDKIKKTYKNRYFISTVELR